MRDIVIFVVILLSITYCDNVLHNSTTKVDILILSCPTGNKMFEQVEYSIDSTGIIHVSILKDKEELLIPPGSGCIVDTSK